MYKEHIFSIKISWVRSLAPDLYWIKWVIGLRLKSKYRQSFEVSLFIYSNRTLYLFALKMGLAIDFVIAFIFSSGLVGLNSQATDTLTDEGTNNR